jgi:hypothetical protein
MLTLWVGLVVFEDAGRSERSRRCAPIGVTKTETIAPPARSRRMYGFMTDRIGSFDRSTQPSVAGFPT